MQEITIATAPSRHATYWTNHHTDKQELTLRAYQPHTIAYTQQEWDTLPKTDRDNIKDVGGFVAGHLKGGRRRKGTVLHRSFITLDLDNLPTTLDLTDHLANHAPYGWLAHTTLSHTPKQPRWRLWIWLTRTISPDEYEATARRIAQDLNPGLDWFDPTTFQPERFMYWPAATQDAPYYRAHVSHNQPDLNPDSILARYDTWTDLTTWPGITAEDAARRATNQRVGNPCDKPGLLGAFNRAYSIDDAIAAFLDGVYTRGTLKNRYTYTRGSSTNGLIVYDAGRLCFSQHSTDPAANGHTHSAFDLVRIHRYGHLDDGAPAGPGVAASKQPSYEAMVEMVSHDPRTKAENAKETAALISDYFDVLEPPGPPSEARDGASGNDDASSGGVALADASDAAGGVHEWLAELETKKNGEFKETITNFELIFQNDPRFTHIAWNTHTHQLHVRDPQALPWKQVKPGWTDNDEAMLKTTIAHTYQGLYHPQKMREALVSVASSRPYHPVRDYFTMLPPWDGIPRLDTLLVDYLGAADTDYVRAVTRKTLVAAHRRTFRPGTKFDHVLTLVGPQGIGKSTIFARLAGRWFSDNLTMSDMDKKDGAEKLQGNLIVELAELSGMRRTEVEATKAFITRTEDKFRPAYGRAVESYPRQCILVGSTNAQDGFLRDSTGGRRWWAVAVSGDAPLSPMRLQQSEIDQIWAEARERDRQGEKLYLEGELLEVALKVQAENVEIDDRLGLVVEYLDTLLPENWDVVPLGARRAFLSGGQLPPEFRGGGVWEATRRREMVSKIEIWAECFGQDPEKMERRHALEISAIMSQVEGWVNTGRQRRIGVYGKQRVFEREVVAADLGV